MLKIAGEIKLLKFELSKLLFKDKNRFSSGNSLSKK